MRSNVLTFLFFSLLLLAACKKDSKPIPNSILFLGHIYESHTKIDKRIERLNLDKYEHIWLGGDVCANSDKEYSILEYINETLKVDAPQNYWTLGNHDVLFNHYDWIEKITGKKEFYTKYHKGMTVMVMNTVLKDPECSRLEAQYEMFQQLCDTIQESSHLIVLSHYVIWNHVKNMPNLWRRANANNPTWESRCQAKSRFEHVLYNRLVEVQKRGVQVVFISGDYGQKDKKFQFQCEEDIWFLASGLDRSNKHMPDSLQETAKDFILLLDHSPENRTLTWNFLDLDSLLDKQTTIFGL